MQKGGSCVEASFNAQIFPVLLGVLYSTFPKECCMHSERTWIACHVLALQLHKSLS